MLKADTLRVKFVEISWCHTRQLEQCRLSLIPVLSVIIAQSLILEFYLFQKLLTYFALDTQWFENPDRLALALDPHPATLSPINLKLAGSCGMLYVLIRVFGVGVSVPSMSGASRNGQTPEPANYSMSRV